MNNSPITRAAKIKTVGLYAAAISVLFMVIGLYLGYNASDQIYVQIGLVFVGVGLILLLLFAILLTTAAVLKRKSAMSPVLTKEQSVSKDLLLSNMNIILLVLSVGIIVHYVIVLTGERSSADLVYAFAILIVGLGIPPLTLVALLLNVLFRRSATPKTRKLAIIAMLVSIPVAIFLTYAVVRNL